MHDARLSDWETRRSGPAFAAIDLGTNNCRLLVGAPTGDGFRVLESFSRIVRLGEGLNGTGRLTDSAIERAMAALHSCAGRLARRPVHAVRAIATEACRRAENATSFLDRVQAETGLRVDVISPREEVELAIESCAPLMRNGRRALLFDIGGGSTELAWVRLPDGGGRPELIGTVSLPVGVVTLAEHFAGAGFGAEDHQAMVDEIAERLWPFERVHRIRQEIRQGGVRLVGTSGTVTTLAGLALDLPRYSRQMIDGLVLSRADAEAALARLRDMGHRGLAAHPCIGPDRAEFVMPGCAVFSAIHRVWPVEEIVVADRGLREGMLIRMMRADRTRGRRERRPGLGLAGMPMQA